MRDMSDETKPRGKSHPHQCPTCETVWDCDEGGWHGIDYRWYVRCEPCKAAAAERRDREEAREAETGERQEARA